MAFGDHYSANKMHRCIYPTTKKAQIPQSIIIASSKKLTYTLKNSITSGDRGEAPDPMIRTRPPSFSLILLKTNLSQIGEAFLPETIG